MSMSIYTKREQTTKVKSGETIEFVDVSSEVYRREGKTYFNKFDNGVKIVEKVWDRELSFEEMDVVINDKNGSLALLGEGICPNSQQ